jgi:hypothetical protein
VDEQVPLDTGRWIQMRDHEDVHEWASAVVLAAAPPASASFARSRAASLERETTASPRPYKIHMGAKLTELLGPTEPIVQPSSASQVPHAR